MSEAGVTVVNGITEFRWKLREHDIEYEPTKFSTLQTTFTANGIEWIVTEREATGELFVEPRHGLTPEQAIAATLGCGTCEMEYGGNITPDTAKAMGVYFCSECGSPIYNDCMPYFCSYCGKAVRR